MESPEDRAVKRRILEEFEGALYEEGAVIETETRSNAEAIHSSTQMAPVGQTLHPEENIQIATPSGFFADITINKGAKTIVYPEEDDDSEETTQLKVDVEDLSSGRMPECPCCLTEFDDDQWEDMGGFGCRSGGHTDYACPERDCEGSIRVYI